VENSEIFWYSDLMVEHSEIFVVQRPDGGALGDLLVQRPDGGAL